MNLLRSVALLASLVALEATNDALLIIDVQNCFIKGNLPVTNATDAVKVINHMLDAKNFQLVVKTQDWHTSNHISFASSHKAAPFLPRQLIYDVSKSGQCTVCGDEYSGRYSNVSTTCDAALESGSKMKTFSQELWPDHCIQGTDDARFHESLDTACPPTAICINVTKGKHEQVDSYSAVKNKCDDYSETDLRRHLAEHHIDNVYVVGLALDYCVKFTALDVKALGYNTTVVLDATRPVAKDTGDAAVKELLAQHVNVVNSFDVQSEQPRALLI